MIQFMGASNSKRTACRAQLGNAVLLATQSPSLTPTDERCVGNALSQ